MNMKTNRAAMVAIALVSGYPSIRLCAQDSSAIDRGVRIGISYRPGVRPGLVVLPVRQPALDSLRAILTSRPGLQRSFRGDHASRR
jgi:hypothetical protein